MNAINKSWFMKYEPTIIDDLIFDNSDHETLMRKWIENEAVDGNILFYGPAGLGKTASAQILIKSIVKARNDIFVSKTRSVKEFREEIEPFVRKRAARSKQKLIYIEEIDKISGDASNVLKKDLMEKFQEHSAFIGCTNHIRRLEKALLSRFSYRIPFSGTNTEGIINRLGVILQTENIGFDINELRKFVEVNQSEGIRDLINMLQVASRSLSADQQLDFNKISKGSGVEEVVYSLVISTMNAITQIDPRSRIGAIRQPMSSPIASDYQKMVALLQNNPDIDYDMIFTKLYDKISVFIPMGNIVSKYANDMSSKKFPEQHLISCWYELANTVIELTS